MAFLAAFLIVVELALGTISSDIARWAFDPPALGGHLHAIRWSS